MLSRYKQFVIFCTAPSATRPGKTDKFPCDHRTGRKIDAHDPQYWTDRDTATAAALSRGAGWGIGFVFTENDPFWFLDIDGAYAGGAWSPIAVSLCQLFAGCLVEVSGSHTGLHIIGSGKPPAHKTRNATYGLEFYSSKRFVALTGISEQGDAGADMSAVLPSFVATYFAPDADSAPEAWTDGPCEGYAGPKDDATLLSLAMKSQSSKGAFGGGATFADLFLGNLEVLARAYPAEGRDYDASAADSALAQHLAFWTGKDCERIRRIMEGSALKRDKWERSDYLPRTIMSVVARQTDVAGGKVEAAVAAIAQAAPGAGIAARVGGYMNVDAQVNHFAGCIYVSQSHRALLPNGSLVKQDQFNALYGGYQFAYSAHGETKYTRRAWEVFTESESIVFPQVDGMVFRPDLAEREIVTLNRLRYVNTFIPVDIRRVKGDPGRFLDHLAKVLPDERDRSILLAYMAAVVQHQGVKFQWAPLLQGVEGNGKTLFTRCVAYAVGERYTHWVNPKKLGKDFNSWMFGKIFYAVEDIYVSESKREVMEDLKPMITNTTIEIEAKGVDQITAHICGNFMFNSNHKDAVMKTGNDRRFCVMFSAQQTAEDLTRDGMGGDYFPALYKWLNADGYAIVADYLQSYVIADSLNPAVDCQRAPVTSSTEEAVGESRGVYEQEVLECVEQGYEGFCGDYISSVMLDRMTERLGYDKRISRKRRAAILKSLGYIHHPALKANEGRTNTNVLPDNMRTRIWIKVDSLKLQITDAYEVAKSYEAANRAATRLPFAKIA